MHVKFSIFVSGKIPLLYRKKIYYFQKFTSLIEYIQQQIIENKILNYNQMKLAYFPLGLKHVMLIFLFWERDHSDMKDLFPYMEMSLYQ